MPETLPSHASMMTGLYPAGHGVHENARYLPGNVALLADKLQAAGYHTAAFVSAYVLNRRFGLARGFDAYNDEFSGGRNERDARESDRSRWGSRNCKPWCASSPPRPSSPARSA